MSTQNKVNILVVHPEDAVRSQLARTLEKICDTNDCQEASVATAGNYNEALDHIKTPLEDELVLDRKSRPIDVIVTSKELGDLGSAKEIIDTCLYNGKFPSVIVASKDTSDAKEVLSYGAYDYVHLKTKTTPSGLKVEKRQLFADIAALCLEEHWSATQDYVDARLRYLATAMKNRLSTTSKHSERLVHNAGFLANAFGLNDHHTNELLMAAKFHDCGKVCFPLEVLGNRDVKDVSVKEEYVYKHPIWGANLLAQVPVPMPVSLIVAMHHYYPNGEGYPPSSVLEKYGRKANAKVQQFMPYNPGFDQFDERFNIVDYRINLSAGIVTVTDAHIGARTKTTYRPGKGVRDTFDEIQSLYNSGRYLKPVVEKYLPVLKEDLGFDLDISKPCQVYSKK